MPPRSSAPPTNRHARSSSHSAAAIDCSASQASTKNGSNHGAEVTTVTVWLKEQLEEAWRRECNLKKLV